MPWASVIAEHPDAVEYMVKGLAGVVTAAADQAQAMTDAELGALLLSGRWTTIEVHEAGRRLAAASSTDTETGGSA